jgi:putative ABC transport system permease protein
MAVREILRRPRSFFVPVAILLLLALLLLYPSAILDGILEDTSAAIEHAPADLIVYSTAANGVILRSRIDSSMRSTVEGVEGVGQVASFDVILFAGRVEGRDQPVGFAVQASDQPIGSKVPGPGEAFADASLREKAGLHEGSEVVVGPLRVPVKVVGFMEGTNLWFAGGLVVDKATWLATLGQVLPPAPAAPAAGDGGAAGAAPPAGGDAPTTDPAAQGATSPLDGATTTAPDPSGSDVIQPLARGALGSPAQTQATTTTTVATSTTAATSTTPSTATTAATSTTAGSVPAAGGGGTTVPATSATGGSAGTGGSATPAAPATEAPEPPAVGTQALLVDVAGGADPEAVAAAIDAATDGATQTLTRTAAVRAMPGVEQQEQTFGYIRLVTLTVALVVVGLFLSFMTLERAPLYAVLKAIGASSRQLFVVLIVQVVMITLIAVLAAAGVTWALTRIPFELPTLMRPERLVETLLALTATAVVGSTLSLRRVVRVDPADAIG